MKSEMELPLENRIHIRKWNFTKKVIFLPITPVNLYNITKKHNFRQNMSILIINDKKIAMIIRGEG